MNRSLSFISSLFIICAIVFFGCSPYKHISEDGFLLSKNKVLLEGDALSKSDFQNLIKQDPNGSFLGLKMGMYFYSLSPKGDDSTMRFWSRNIFRSLGSKPVEYNENLAERSVEEMNSFLKIKGCFNGVAKDSLIVKGKKRKVVVEYKISTFQRYKVDTFYTTINDSSLLPTLNKVLETNPIKKGIYYDETIFASFRSYLARKFREDGYFSFSEDYVEYIIDTSNNNHTAKVNLRIKNPTSIIINDDTIKSTIEYKHKVFRIRNIYVYPNYIPQTSPYYIVPKDTSIIFHRPKEKMGLNKYYFIYSKPLQIKSKPILRSVYFQYDSVFSPILAERTYNSISRLKNFKFIDISYNTPSSLGLKTMINDTLALDCFIRLSLAKPISLSASWEANFSAVDNPFSNTSSNLGTEWNLGFQHKNLFKSAEIFSSNLKFAIEIKSDIFSKRDTVNTWSLVNAFEAGIDFGIEIPRFLIPFGTRFYSMQFRPHTSIKTGYNYQKRPYFERSIFNLTYGYSWSNTIETSHLIAPIEINLVKMNITNDKYADYINSLDKRIQYQSSDHFVMDARYSFIYNGQQLNKKLDFSYFRFNAEIAGNLLYGLSAAFNAPKNSEGEYKVFNIPYSQYFRTDIDYKKYVYLNQKDIFIYRVYAGFGLPYGNASALPYEKSFFGGGANNLRAWQLREVGPGSSQLKEGQLRYDRSGDIAIGANVEFRFPIVGMLEGATFLDLGNVWTLKDIKDMEGGRFRFDSFYKEIAAGIGIGLRLNIQFLILRFDFATKVYDPSLPLSERFVLDDFKLSKLAINFGIGYPF